MDIRLKGNISLKESEKRIIEHVLKDCDYNRGIASKILNISLRTMHRKIKRYAEEKELKEKRR